jgi:hypothetical protein
MKRKKMSYIIAFFLLYGLYDFILGDNSSSSDGNREYDDDCDREDYDEDEYCEEDEDDNFLEDMFTK